MDELKVELDETLLRTQSTIALQHEAEASLLK